MQRHYKSSPQLEKSIAVELVKLAEARQAAVNRAGLEIYSAHLSRYPMEDIRAACATLSLTKRNEGETAFPDLPTIDEAVKVAFRNRRIAEDRVMRQEREETEERNRRENPEDFVSVSAMVGDFFKSKGMEVLPPEKPTRAVCEHCNGVQLSAFRPDDLRALADAMEGKKR